MGGKWEALVSKNQRILDKRVEEYCKEHPCHLLLLFIPSIALGAITSYLLIQLLFDISFGLVMFIFLAIVFIPPILYYAYWSSKVEKYKNEVKNQLNSQQESNKKYVSETLDKKKEAGFILTEHVADVSDDWDILIDDHKKEFVVILSKSRTILEYAFDSLVDYELYEDGRSIIKSTAENTAFADTLLYGKAGAAAAATAPKEVHEYCSDVHITLVINDMKRPQIIIPLISMETLKTSVEYRFAIETAKKITAMCAVIKANQTSKETKEEKAEKTDSADQYAEISKIFELKEKGIITEEELNTKKKQLLGL